MPTTVEEIHAAIQNAVAPGFRGRLVDRGEARSMVWRDGVVPTDTTPFAANLTYDLTSYAYSLLSMGLRLKESNGRDDIARVALERAAVSLESVLLNGRVSAHDRSFHFIVAASAYHLARFSARAYSLLRHGEQFEGYSQIEKCLMHLIFRDFRTIEKDIIDYRVNGLGTDTSIAATLDEAWRAKRTQAEFDQTDGESFVYDALARALTDTYLASVGLFLFALQRGEGEFVAQAIERLRTGLQVCGEVNLLPQWWAFRLTLHIVDDLWSSSFHQRLPLLPNNSHEQDWASLRRRFIALLFCRSRAEVDLWPSQLDSASLAANENDDLVVSLPTSAGKTRIAELCILRCLAANKRVVFVTPLRALSAQTEMSLQRTFIPLGKSISTLYGSIGTSEFEEDALGSKSIIVATPEKLDFALRNNPSLLDDVGLIVLDEGHMIGLGEREVRYEVQIQRLLKRTDAHTRRIVCLSAILPEGEQLEDFVAWLKQDGEGHLVKNTWRPTRLRFGEITWIAGKARLDIRVGGEKPYVNGLFAAVTPSRPRRKLFPSDHREFVLATAWHQVGEGQSVLIYCPERRSVEPYARAIVQLHKQGLLKSVIANHTASRITRALTIGREWLGNGHPILQCLKMGVAVHHGALPTPYRKEVEALLRDGVLSVTISSPTLAQGLNLSATVILLHGIIRNGEVVAGSEFRNVVGRAGRAFVDVEGLVLMPFFTRDPQLWRKWNKLLDEDGGREMESGLLRLAASFIVRLQKRYGGNWEQIAEYILNNAAAWNFPPLASESADERMSQERTWNQHLVTLDTALLSLLGEQDIPDDQVAIKLDQLLSSSLWDRRSRRYNADVRNALDGVLKGRSKFLWSSTSQVQRRSYFLAGLGYEAGRKLDEVAKSANALLVKANEAIVAQKADAAVASLIALAEIIFAIEPFVPDPFPDNWRDILSAWLRGVPLADFVKDDTDVLRFVEGGLIYKLPWGMEALRVRATATNELIDDGVLALPISMHETGVAVPAVETGTLNRAAAVLMQAGFNSRIAAIKAVNDTKATFTGGRELQRWLSSKELVVKRVDPNWPTTETSQIFRSFVSNFQPPDRSAWKDWTYDDNAIWLAGAPRPKSPVRVIQPDGGKALVLGPDYTLLGHLQHPLNPKMCGLMTATVRDDQSGVAVGYLGPADLTPQQPER